MPVGAGKWLPRSPVTHTENSLYWPCLTRERGKKNQLTKIKNEDQSVVVRLKDTQLHQPSSLWASHKASLCLKLGALEQEMSTRLGLSQGGAQRDVVFQRLYPSVRTFYSMPPFPLRSNMGIFIQYAQFQFLMGKAHFCSTASLWAKAFSVSAQHRGCREEFAIILQWVMNPHGSHLQHVIHGTSQRRKRPFPAAQLGWTASAAILNPRAPGITLLHGTHPCWNCTYHP